MSRIILFFWFIAFQTTNAQDTSFSLEGKTSNIEDGTYLYLRDLIYARTLDSAQVKNNRFRFNTELREPAVFAGLHIKDLEMFTIVWLEDNPMFFDASNGDFEEAKVAGSKNQILYEELYEEVKANYLEVDRGVMRQREKDFIKRNPDAVVSAYLLFANPLWNQKEIGEFFSSLTEEVQNSSMAQKRIAPDLEKDLPEPGENYLDFSIPNSEGEIKNISELTGKLTLLQFWDSHCMPSRSMNATLADVYQKYHSEGLEIINISKNFDKEDWLQAIKEDDLCWPQLSNLQGWNGEVFRAYGVHATPSNFLINSDGIIVDRNLRGDEIENMIKEHLAK